VYFGTDLTAVTNADTGDAEFMGNQAGTTYDPTGDLAPLTTYYWRIDEVDDEDNVTTGDVWSFTTRRQTYYIGATHTGDYSGSDRSNLMTPVEFMAMAEPGDTALWQPGSYGNILINNGYGTESGGYVTQKADPDTCTPRSSAWWYGDIDPPSSSEAPVLTRLWIASYGSGTPTGHWVWIEGLSIVAATANQPLYFYQLVDHVTIKDCGLWGVVPSTWPYSESNELSVGVEMDAGSGNHNSNITFDGMYVEGCATGWTFKYDGHDVLLKDCRVNKVYSQCMTFWDDVTLDHCHISGEIPVADSGNIMAGPGLTITSVGDPANTTFTHTGGHVSSVQWVRVQGGGDNELRKVLTYNDSTIVLDTALSFNMVAETHTVTLYNQTHGSALCLWDSGVTIRNCIIHDISGTGLCYLYTDGITDITLENNLFYDCANPDHIVDFTTNGDMGNNFTMINNTVISTRNTNYPADISNSTYGKAMLINLKSGSDGSTWTVCNNILVGAASSMPAGAIVKNNILYAGSSFEEDAVGDNQGNIVYYASESYPNEPHPFESGFFVTGSDWATAFTTWHHRDYNAAFKLGTGSPAINAGSSSEGEYTTTDFEGNSRGGSPDIGFDEYVTTGGRRRVLIVQ